MTSRLYHDEGDYYNYRDGDYHLAIFQCERPSENSLILTATHEGERPLPRARLHLHGLTSEPNEILIDGKPVPAGMCIDLPPRFERLEVTLA